MLFTTPLLKAILDKNHDECVRIIESGVDVNKPDEQGRTPLTLASIFGNKRICNLLIISGAGVNKTSEDGYTPLGLAVCNGHKEICQLLISNRANVNQFSGIEKETPLFIASLKGNKEICKILISSGANPKQSAPLKGIALRGCNEIFELLTGKINEVDQEILFHFLLERTFNPKSPFYKDHLALDMFKLILRKSKIPFILPKRKGKKEY